MIERVVQSDDDLIAHLVPPVGNLGVPYTFDVDGLTPFAQLLLVVATSFMTRGGASGLPNCLLLASAVASARAAAGRYHASAYPPGGFAQFSV
jgi:hypothetical protein